MADNPLFGFDFEAIPPPFVPRNDIMNFGEGDIFVYTGGRAPRDVRRAKIDESIETIPWRAFLNCTELVEVEGHKKLKKIGEMAFFCCYHLRRFTKMDGVTEIGRSAFKYCHYLCDGDVKFDKVEIVGDGAFSLCKFLRSISLPSVKRIGQSVFFYCERLTDAVFGKELGRIEGGAFSDCYGLRRIAIPLKDGLDIGYRAFYNCTKFSRVDAIEEVHKTISSLHLESWRGEMKEEIDSINQTLPEIPAREKTVRIQRWIRSTIDRMEHYKAEHQILLKEAMTLLELALWKAKLEGNRSNIDTESVEVVRKQHRVTCGANIVIKNVLPFLVLK
jgi:hypothetical protein